MNIVISQNMHLYTKVTYLKHNNYYVKHSSSLTVTTKNTISFLDLILHATLHEDTCISGVHLRGNTLICSIHRGIGVISVGMHYKGLIQSSLILILIILYI